MKTIFSDGVEKENKYINDLFHRCVYIPQMKRWYQLKLINVEVHIPCWLKPI